eukprot:750033-Hanusia_phi.AAC.2
MERWKLFLDHIKHLHVTYKLKKSQYDTMLPRACCIDLVIAPAITIKRHVLDESNIQFLLLHDEMSKGTRYSSPSPSQTPQKE